MEKVRVRYFQSLLQGRRQELLSRLNHVKEESRPNEHDYGRDEGDRAKSFEAKELLSRLNGQERLMLDAIERALRRVDEGTFGVSANCQKEIGRARLEAAPWELRIDESLALQPLSYTQVFS
jgi:DnaK suppressor protein